MDWIQSDRLAQFLGMTDSNEGPCETPNGTYVLDVE